MILVNVVLELLKYSWNRCRQRAYGKHLPNFIVAPLRVCAKFEINLDHDVIYVFYSIRKGYTAARYAVRCQLQRAEQFLQRQTETPGNRTSVLERRRTNDVFPKSHSGRQSEHKHQSKCFSCIPFFFFFSFRLHSLYRYCCPVSFEIPNRTKIEKFALEYYLRIAKLSCCVQQKQIFFFLRVSFR